MAGPGPSRHSFPAPSEPSLRRLGVGGGPGGDRPLRAPVIIAVVVALLLVGVPLYVLRKPGAVAPPPPSATVEVPTLASASSGAAASAGPPELRMDPPERVRCSSSPKRKGLKGNLCDRLPTFEAKLKKAIQAAVDCKPTVTPPEEGTVNYVLKVDFRTKAYAIFAGQSGKWRGPQAKRAATCVQQRLEPLDFDVPHQYRYYLIAVMTTYPVVPPPGLPGAPVF